jgi:RNA polymerase sigma factor (sigma-70 family)
MEFYPDEIVDGYNAEKFVWEKVKIAFKDDPGVAFHRYQLIDTYGNLEREIDILIVHRELGLWIIECKGCRIDNIASITGCEWNMQNWHLEKGKEEPLNQAQKQMFALKKRLIKMLNFWNLLSFNFRVAIPLISQKEWESKGFHNILNIEEAVLTEKNIQPDTLKNKLIAASRSKQKKLTEEQWYSLLSIFGINNQISVDKPFSDKYKDIPGEKGKTHKIDSFNQPPSKPIQLTDNLSDQQPQNQPDNKLPYLPGMTQANIVSENIYQPEVTIIGQPDIELEEILIEDDDDLLLSDDSDDEFIESQSDEDDSKSGKGVKSRRRAQVKKKHYTEDSIRLYLQEIARIRLLRSDEEIELARKIADLLELERIREELSQQLDRDPKDSEWAKAVQVPLPQFRYRLHIGRRAKDKMVQSNLRLVVSIAKKYMNRGLSFQDLIQEGSLGLIRAAEKFDHEKGYKFSTYATWWIRQAITRAIADQSRTIRLPVHLYETISRIKITTKLLSQEMGRKPTEEEIATRMEMTIEKLRFIAKSAQLPISLDTPIHINKDPWFDKEPLEEYLCLADFIEADFIEADFIETDGQTPEEQFNNNMLREDVEKLLNSLKPDERDVLRLRYGWDDGHMKTLEEIAETFNVTCECIHQIEAKALRKLRHPNRNSILKEYICGFKRYNSRQNKSEEESLGNQAYTSEQQRQNSTYYVQIALACHRRGDFLEAINGFTQAIELDQNNTQLYYYRGIVYENLSQYSQALEDYNQVLKINDNFVEAYYQIGNIHYNLGNYQQALENLDILLRISSNNFQAYNKRSSIRAALKDFQGAMEDLQKASNLTNANG